MIQDISAAEEPLKLQILQSGECDLAQPGLGHIIYEFDLPGYGVQGNVVPAMILYGLFASF